VRFWGVVAPDELVDHGVTSIVEVIVNADLGGVIAANGELSDLAKKAGLG
jgi:hypothetical protein